MVFARFSHVRHFGLSLLRTILCDLCAVDARGCALRWLLRTRRHCCVLRVRLFGLRTAFAHFRLHFAACAPRRAWRPRVSRLVCGRFSFTYTTSTWLFSRFSPRSVTRRCYTYYSGLDISPFCCLRALPFVRSLRFTPLAFVAVLDYGSAHATYHIYTFHVTLPTATTLPSAASPVFSPVICPPRSARLQRAVVHRFAFSHFAFYRSYTFGFRISRAALTALPGLPRISFNSSVYCGSFSFSARCYRSKFRVILRSLLMFCGFGYASSPSYRPRAYHHRCH